MSSTDDAADTYPYGRQGNPRCYYNEQVSLAQLKQSGRFEDNAVKFFDAERVAVLYEAPAEDDPARGHYSVWTARGGKQTYRKVEDKCITGDDGMCFEKFKSATLDSLGL